MSILKFKPIYQERVWGGRKLEEKMGRSLPANKTIGESWEVVDRPEAQSIAANGPWEGKTLRDLVKMEGDYLFGPGNNHQQPFPVLVKWLDCCERLSLQVHPPAEAAQRFGGEPKTENWYVAEATADAKLLVGLQQGVTRQDFEKALREETLEALVHRIPSRAGDSLLVRSGRLHAIDGGNLILEIQQNSDTTYRVFDWGRVGLDGAPRDLHVEQSMSCIDFKDFEPEPIRDDIASSEQCLADCDEFRIRRFRFPGARKLNFPANEQPSLIHMISGGATFGNDTLTSGETALVPFAAEEQLEMVRPSVFLVTDGFFSPKRAPSNL